MLILTIVQLDIALEFFSLYFVFTACNLVSMFLCVISVKVFVCVCEDGVKLNYYHSIRS